MGFSMMVFHETNFLMLMLACVSAGLVLGHNLWLVAKDKCVTDGESLRIEANTSDSFPGSESAVRPERVADFRLVSAEGSTPITEYRVEGRSLVASVKGRRAGACIAALTLYPCPITLEPDKFARYVADEDAAARVAPQFQLSLTAVAQRESYTKYAKALIGAEAQGDETFRRAVGHRLEIVPQREPRAARGEKIPVRVTFDGRALANLRVSSGREGLEGGGYAAHTLTDESGLATVALSAPGHWFIRTHHIRPCQDAREADWESFWASLTFRVPETGV